MTKEQVLFWMEGFEVAAELELKTPLDCGPGTGLSHGLNEATFNLERLSADSLGSLQETGAGVVQKTADRALHGERFPLAE